MQYAGYQLGGVSVVEILELLLGEILPREEIFEGGGLPDHWKKSHLKGRGRALE